MRKKTSFIKLIQVWGIIFLMGLGVSVVAIDVISSYRDFNFRADQMRADYIARQKQIIKQEVARVVDTIRYEKEQSESLTRRKIKSRIYEAYSIAQNIYEQNQPTENKAKIQQMILDALRPIRFENGIGYYFATRLDGVEVLFADRPQMEGLNLLNMQDTRGRYVIKDMIEIAKKSGEGFYEYHWTKPESAGNDFKKISFIKRFTPYDWFIGTGLYVDDVESQIKADLLSAISRIRFGKEGYIFVNKFNGDALVSNGKLFPGTKKLWEVFNDNPEKMKNIFEKEYNAALKPEGDYIYYSHMKLTNPNKESPKASFIYGIPDLQWLVGAGVYLDDVETDIALMQSELNNQIKVKVLYFTLIIIAMSAVFSLFYNWLAKGLKKDFKLFILFFNRVAHSDEEIDRENIKFLELDQMSEYANKMLTDRKQAEAVLRESEAKYRMIAENTNDLIRILDLDTMRVTYASPSVKKNTGYTVEEYSNRAVEEILTPQSLKMIMEVLSEGLKRNANREGDEDITDRIEWQEYHKDGHLVWVEVDTNFIRDDHGKPIGVIGVSRDISERKKNEEALKEIEERYKSIFDRSLNVIFLYDLQGNFIDANEAALKLMGYNHQEFTGLNIFNIIYSDDMPKSKARAEKLFKAGFADESEEFRVRTKQGDVRFMEARAVLLYKDNQPYAIQGIATDITERKKAIAELKTRNQYIETILDNLPIGIAVHQISGTTPVIYMNDKFEEIYGWTKEQIKDVGTFFEKIYPGQKEVKEQVMADIISGDLSRMKWTGMEATGKNGGKKIISATNIPLMDQGLMISTVQDITEHKRAEEEKAVLEAQLQQTRKLESIGTLAGGIAHDFNNILSAIIGYSELALDHAQEGSAQYRDIREVLIAGNRAKELVQQILTFARHSGVEMKPIRAKYIVEEALKLLRSSTPSTIEIHQYIDSDAIISANTTQIHQMVMNLCTNAAHAMETHGGILSVHLDEVALDNNFAELHPEIVPGSYLHLSVQDTGHGMGQDIIEKIFEPYFTTKKIGEGTGLGLSVIKGIVQSCNGLITVKSELGKGCIFDVYLPVLNRETKVATGPVETEKAPTGDERILFVDDEPPIAIMGEQLLGKLGYQVAVRTSAVEALELFKTNPDRFDLVITDMTMPYMTGDVLAAELRKIRPDIPMILCTGYSKAISDERAKEIGINAFLMKPVVNIQLAKTVRKVLDEAKGDD